MKKVTPELAAGWLSPFDIPNNLAFIFLYVRIILPMAAWPLIPDPEIYREDGTREDKTFQFLGGGLELCPLWGEGNEMGRAGTYYVQAIPP